MIPTSNRELKQIKHLLIEQITLFKDIKKELETININTTPPSIEI